MASERIEHILETIGTQAVPPEALQLAEQACSDFVKDLPRKQPQRIVKMWEIMIAHLVAFIEDVKKMNLDELHQKRY